MAKISKKAAMEKLENFQNLKSILIFIPSTNEILRIAPTDTGDSLLLEDLMAGNNDYIYCTHQFYQNADEGFGEMTDEDAPMLYFNNKKQNYNSNIAEAVIPVLRMHFPSGNPSMVEDFIPLTGEPADMPMFCVKLFVDGHYHVLNTPAKSKTNAIDEVFERHNLDRNADCHIVNVAEGATAYEW